MPYSEIIAIVGMATAVFLFVLSKKHNCKSVIEQVKNREALKASYSKDSIEYDPVKAGERIYEEKLQSYQKELEAYTLKKQRYDDEMATYDERLARAEESERAGKKHNEEIERHFKTELQKLETGDDEYIRDQSLRIAEIKDEIDKMDLLSERYMDSIPEIITILNDYRADSIKEAINVLEQDRHSVRMEEAQLRHNMTLQEQNEKKNIQIAMENMRHNREMEAMHRNKMEEIKRHNTAMEEASRHQAEASQKEADIIAMCTGCTNAPFCHHKGEYTLSCSRYRLGGK